MRSIYALVIGLVLTGSTWARADIIREGKFDLMDKNDDGVLTLEEYGGHPGNFRAMDCNHDGVLTRDEYVNRYQCTSALDSQPPATAYSDRVYMPSFYRMNTSQRQDRFYELDRNDDGVLSRWELRDNALFDRLDRNRDGVVDEDEFLNASRIFYDYRTHTWRSY